jgi:hypothetical protein
MTAALLVAALVLAPVPASRPAAAEGDERGERPIRFVEPAPEMRKVAALLGTWNLVETWKEPADYKRGDYEGVPGTGGSGTLTVRPGPGGFSVLLDYEARNPMGHVTALAVLSWDPARRLYELDEVHSAFPGVLHLTGRFEKGDLVFRGEDARTGDKRSIRLAWRGLGADTWTSSSSAVTTEFRRPPPR